MLAVPYQIYRQTLLVRRAVVLSAMGSDRGQSSDGIAEEDQGKDPQDLSYSQLRLINETLDRINSGDFGLCLSCNGEIPQKQLTALPWARYCVPCQEQINIESAVAEQSLRVSG